MFLMKKYFIFLLSALLCFAAGCAGGETTGSTPDATPEPAPKLPPENKPVSAPESPSDEPIPDVITGRIEMEDGGVIDFELYPDIAPETVRNFVYLARQGFYDGLKFHRIMNGFMIQGGCPLGEGVGNPGYSIFGEFAQNGFENSLNHTRGVMSMARSPSGFDTAGSQFFICHGDPSSLNGGYAAFGKVTDGMDVVDRIADTPNNGGNGSVAPSDMPVMLRIIIDGNFAMDEPNKLPR